MLKVYSIFLLLFTITSCNKDGNNTFSLRSKHSRLVGIWSVYKAEYDSTFTKSVQVIDPLTLNLFFKKIPTIKKYYYLNNIMSGNNSSENFTHRIVFKKNGEFYFEKSYIDRKEKISGNWIFSNKKKNSSFLLIQIKSSIITPLNGIEYFNNIKNINLKYNINKLSNDEIEFTYSDYFYENEISTIFSGSLTLHNIRF